MAQQEYEFILILSGVQELTREVLDAFYESGCDDALIGMRDGVAYAEFCREADSFQGAALSAIRDVEKASVGAKVQHVEPDELVTVSEIGRRLGVTREGIRKRVAGTRGPGKFPPPAGCLTQRSPLWHWTDVVRWHQEYLPRELAETSNHVQAVTDTNSLVNLGPYIAALNAALDLRRRVPLEDAVLLLQRLNGGRAAGVKPPNIDQQPGEAMELTRQTVGNIGLYYVCYRLSRFGWNVMPTSRNARGVDIIAYSQDAARKLTFQVKSLSKRHPVGLGKNLSHLIADFFIVCRFVHEDRPECFVLTAEEVKQLADRHGKGGREAYMLHSPKYEAAKYLEKWERISAAPVPTGT